MSTYITVNSNDSFTEYFISDEVLELYPRTFEVVHETLHLLESKSRCK